MAVENILFIGLGGAGQRHLRIFRELLGKQAIFSAFRQLSATPLLNSDFSVNYSDTVQNKYQLKLYDSIDEAFKVGPQITVISTPTSMHKEIMMRASCVNSGIFVEKPWAENLLGFEEFKSGIIEKKIPFIISFQRRFHPQLVKIKNLIDGGVIGKVALASFTVFSNVKSWHPYEDWRRLYAVRAEMGGGALLTEIHEIDLAHWFFGIPDTVYCRGGNFSDEEIDVEDSAFLMLSYPDFVVQISICFLHPKPSRGFRISGSSGDIIWDEASNTLIIESIDGKKSIEVVSDYKGDQSFLRQANYFLHDWKLADTKESLKAAEISLLIVEAAKKSMLTGCPQKIYQ